MLQTADNPQSLTETIKDMPVQEDWANILVVENSPMYTFMIKDLIKVSCRYGVILAKDGKEAMRLLEDQIPSLVLADLHMPEMDGIELLQAIKEKYPALPVIIMTSKGSEMTAVNALQAGAASYVSKANLRRDLPLVLSTVLTAAKLDRRKHHLMKSLCRRESEFVLGNDADYVPMLIQHLQEELTSMGLCSASNRTRIGVALEEALLNAIYHGNLGVSSSLKEQGLNLFQEAVAARQKQAPYSNRKLYVSTRFDLESATFVIRDEGDGFDITKLPDPTDPDFLERPSGRGLLLMRAFMDEVSYNDKGNQLTMIKRKDRTR